MTQSTKTHIYVEGPFFINESLAHVNRNLISELQLIAPDQFAINPLEAAPLETVKQSWPQLQQLINRQLPSENKVVLRHLWPPFFLKPQNQKLILIQPWEFTGIPEAWVKPLTAHVDELWVPSLFVKNIFKNNGIPENKIEVIPNGYNPALFTPEGPLPRLPLKAKAIFLYVGGTIKRKGIDILLKAWENSFSASDDVLLIIKDMGKAGAYKNLNAAQDIAKFQQKENMAPLFYLDSDLTEDQMAQLYRLATCLVAPYRGEGFCLPALEAQACGTAVIATAGGPTDEFCSGFSQLAIESKLVNVDVSEPYVTEPKWFEPNGEHLGQLLKHVADNSDTIKDQALEQAADFKDHWTWQKSAEAAWHCLKKYV